MMKLLLGSGGFRTPERRQLLEDEMRSFFGPVERLLFIPFALGDYDRYAGMLVERNLTGGYRLESLHVSDDAVRAIERAEALYVGGGNTFRLVNEVYARGLMEVIRA